MLKAKTRWNDERVEIMKLDLQNQWKKSGVIGQVFGIELSN